MTLRDLPAHLARPLLTLALCATAAAEGVVIADGAGGPTYDSIQAAVDAASDGDVLVVGAGSYDGFVVDGKALTVMALPGQAVELDGAVELLGLAADQHVVLSGLRATGRTLSWQSEPGLRVDACAGLVRVRDCTFVGGEGLRDCDDIGLGRGGDGALLTNSAAVSFTSCTLRGGRGSWYLDTGCQACHAGDAGHGLAASGTPVTVHDGELRGGDGGEDGLTGGRGGDGARVVGFGIFAAGARFRGGDGGDACDFIAPIGGDGGNGLTVVGAQGRLRACSFEGGDAGEASLGTDGSPGVPTSGAPLFFLDGPARLAFGPALAGDGERVRLGYRGEPGERVFLVEADAPGFRLVPGAAGVELVPLSALSGARPRGVVPATGFLPLDWKLDAFGPGAGQARRFAQLVARAPGGDLSYSAPLELAVLRGASAPDCDGDGRNDLLALAEGLAADCQGNLAPDACDIAGGAPDCNANGVPDACDVARGTSRDADGDGVPDSCQGGFTTWHVDAGAAPGGDGSAAAPFRALALGVQTAAPGDTVLVADGVYTGPDNRDLAITVRDLSVRGANGPANCIIDCEGAGRAFLITGIGARGVHVEGLTIRRGAAAFDGGAIYASNVERLRLTHCVFEDCSAARRGGAVFLEYALDTLVTDCRFSRDSADFGGGLYWNDSGAGVVGCTFEGNTATTRGGGLQVTRIYDETGLVSHCVFVANEAPEGGGLFYWGAGNYYIVDEPPLWIDHCLFAGNRAARGGALLSDGTLRFGVTELRLSASTLVFNEATERGGALAIELETDTLVADSILWGNAAPAGPGIHVNDELGRLRVRYCDLEDGASSIDAPAGTLHVGPGLLDADPLFLDPDGADDDPLTFGDNDYRLDALSPCLDAAETRGLLDDLFDLDLDGALSEPTPFELDGAPRLVDAPAIDAGAGAPPLADLGAYEQR